jgi:outer membrane receptor protein involved in Fe transport
MSAGMPGAVPAVRTHAVHGSMTPAEALEKLLEGTGLRAVAVDARTFRLEAVQSRRPGLAKRVLHHLSHREMREDQPGADIVVTATKRPESLASLPIALSVGQPDRLTTGIVSPDSETVASGVDGLAFTNLGPGRNRAFIRGIADSPFNGPSQSTVAMVLDNSRITYDAPDPDLLLIDVDRVEVLKGPQGPLYGSGALGGIFHIVTNAPDLDTPSGAATLVGESGAHGGVGGGGDATLNLPLVTGTLALRAVGYVRADPGWLDTIGGADDTNHAVTRGGRATLRWAPDDDWQVDLGGTLQSLDAADSQYVTGSAGTLDRVHPIAEPADNDFTQAHLDVRGRLAGLRLTSATSYVAQAVDETLDATAADASFGLTGPAVFTDKRRYTIFNQELRVSPDTAGRIDWVAGLSYLHATSSIDGTITAPATTPLQVETIDHDVAEYAAFGEGTLPLGQFTLTAGARLFVTDAADARAEMRRQREKAQHKVGFSPSLSLSWQPAKGRYLFLRFARAIRPGGLAAGSGQVQGQFDSDELSSLEAGARLALAGDSLALNAGAYYTYWHAVQSDYLLADGLISTRNAGNARIVGGDASIDWSIARRWTLSAGINAEQAELISTPQGVHLDDLRLPVAPDVTLRGQVGYRFALGGWTMRLIGQGNYVGSARLSFDPDLDRHMGQYAVVAAAATAQRGPLSVTARLDNLFDIAGDSFAFGNPFSIRLGPQYTPLRPRTLTLSIGFDW